MAPSDTRLSVPQHQAISSALDEFVGDDPGRSVAVVVSGGIDLRAGRHEGQVRPAASLLKVPIVMATFRAGAHGLIDLDEHVTLREMPPSELPALTDVLDRNHRFTVRELCGISLVTSDNPLAQYLLERVGLERVEELFDELGCSSTSLRTGFSDDDLRVRPRHNVSSASDMIRVLGHVLDADEMRTVRHAIERTSKLSRIPLIVRSLGEVRTGHKTGTLSTVCNDVGFVENDRLRMLVAVLCDDQLDVPRCGLAIAECVASVWRALSTSEAA